MRKRDKKVQRLQLEAMHPPYVHTALASSINFKQYDKEVAANSEVLRALQEQESGHEQQGVAGMSAFQEDRSNLATWRLI